MNNIEWDSWWTLFFKGKKCSNAWGEFWASMCCKFRTYNLNGSFHPIHLSSVFSSLKLYHSLLHRREEADELEQLKYWTRDFLSPFEVLQTSVTRLDKWLAGFHTVALQISRFTLRQINEERVAQNSPFNLLMLFLWLNLRVLLKLRYWLLPMVQFECCWNSGHLGLVILVQERARDIIFYVNFLKVQLAGRTTQVAEGSKSTILGAVCKFLLHMKK